MWTSSKHRIAVSGLIFLAYMGNAQPMKEIEGYYLFPIKPGVRNTLAGTMGELRSTHFHTGIDIRTEGRQGLPVVAAADGFVTRIAMSPGGYGNALYLKHPNGQTTVYAHLRSFRLDLAQYVRAEQYKQKTFAINVFPRAGQFTFSKGDTIAISGNSGSSGGPHLHFDIRDKNQALLNPLEYGFNEIVDTRSPVVRTVAFQTKSKNSRVNGLFGRSQFAARLRASNTYQIDTVYAIGKIGIELEAWDRMNGTRFHTGINKIKVEVSGNTTFDEAIETWPFSKSRYFYSYIDYDILKKKKRRFHKLYVDDGNRLDFYKKTSNHGILSIHPGETYPIQVVMADSYGNTSTLSMVIVGKKMDTPPAGLTPLMPAGISYNQNMMVVHSNPSDSVHSASFFVDGKEITREASYVQENCQATFLWDMDGSIPDSVLVGNDVYPTHLVGLIPSAKVYHIYNNLADISFSKSSLFDTLALSLEHKNDTLHHYELLSIGQGNMPLKRTIEVKFKPEHKYKNHEGYFVYQKFGKNAYGFVGGKWEMDNITFQTRELGTFTILKDSLPPKIKPLIVNSDQLVFKIDDKLSGIKKFNAYLNNKWLLMYYDPKIKQIWAVNKEPNLPFHGPFKLLVEDNSGNENTYTTNLN